MVSHCQGWTPAHPCPGCWALHHPLLSISPASSLTVSLSAFPPTVPMHALCSSVYTMSVPLPGRLNPSLRSTFTWLTLAHLLDLCFNVISSRKPFLIPSRKMKQKSLVPLYLSNCQNVCWPSALLGSKPPGGRDRAPLIIS